MRKAAPLPKSRPYSVTQLPLPKARSSGHSVRSSGHDNTDAQCSSDSGAPTSIADDDDNDDHGDDREADSQGEDSWSTHAVSGKCAVAARPAWSLNTTFKVIWLADAVDAWDVLTMLVVDTAHIIVTFFDFDDSVSDVRCILTELAMARGESDYKGRPQLTSQLMQSVSRARTTYKVALGCFVIIRDTQISSLEQGQFCIADAEGIACCKAIKVQVNNKGVVNTLSFAVLNSISADYDADWSSQTKQIGMQALGYDRVNGGGRHGLGLYWQDYDAREFKSAVADYIMDSGARFLFTNFAHPLALGDGGGLRECLEAANAQLGSNTLTPQFVVADETIDCGKTFNIFPMMVFVFGPHGNVKCTDLDDSVALSNLSDIGHVRVQQLPNVRSRGFPSLPNRYAYPLEIGDQHEFQDRPLADELWRVIELKAKETEDHCRKFIDGWRDKWAISENYERNLMPWRMKVWTHGIPDIEWTAYAEERGIPQLQKTQKLGAIKMKTVVTPWGEDFPRVPSMVRAPTADAVTHPVGLDTQGQKLAWDFQFPGAVQMVLFVGTSVSSKKCRDFRHKMERWKSRRAGGQSREQIVERRCTNNLGHVLPNPPSESESEEIRGSACGWRGRHGGRKRQRQY